MKMDSIFTGLITSKMRIRILMRLFQNPGQRVYLRELAQEFVASPSQVSEELRQLNAAGLLTREKQGRQILYCANPKYVLFQELQSMVRKALGMDRILDSIIERLGNLDAALLVGDYALGKDTGIVDLFLVGNVDQRNLGDLVTKTERYIKRRIRALVVESGNMKELQTLLGKQPYLVLWESVSGKLNLKSAPD